MRMKYLGLGERVGNDEFNCLVHVLLSRDYEISEMIYLNPTGFYGHYGVYVFNYNSTTIAYRDADLQVLDNTGSFSVKCNSELNATFKLYINGFVFVSNSNGEIIVDLSKFENDLLIPNNFKIEIEYNEPYINSKINTSGVISKTSELKEVIDTVEPDEVINLNSDVVHDLTSPIKINSNVTIKGTGVISNPNNVAGNLFIVDDDYTLHLEGITFTGFTNTGDGGVIYNNGVLSLNSCVFSNDSSSGNGGAVYNNKGDVYSDYCKFNDCKAVNGAGIFNVGD